MSQVAGDSRKQSLGRVGVLYSKITGEALWVLFGMLSGTVGGLVMVKAFTTQLRPEQYGLLSLGMAAAATLQWPFVCLAQSLLRYTSAAIEQRQLSSFLAAAKRLAWHGVIASTITFAFVLLGLLIFRRTDWLFIAFAAFLLSLATGGSCLVEHLQVAMRHRATVAIHQAVLPWLRITVVLCFVVLWGSYGGNALLALAAATLLLLGSQFVFLRRSLVAFDHTRITNTSLAEPASSDGDVREWSGRLLHYAGPLVAWVGFSSLQLYGDRWALQLFSSAAEVGHYTTLYQLGYSPMVLASGVMSQLMIPVIFGRSGAGKDSARLGDALQLTSQLVMASLVFALFAAVIAGLLHRQVFEMMVAQSYWEVSLYLPCLVLSGGLFAAGQAASYPLLVSNKTRLMMRPKIVTAILGIAMSFTAAAVGGLQWVIYQGPVYALIYLVWMHRVSRRHGSVTSDGLKQESTF